MKKQVKIHQNSHKKDLTYKMKYRNLWQEHPKRKLNGKETPTDQLNKQQGQ